MANDERLTLSVDCGGLFLKSCVLDESGTMHSKPSRIETPYPLSPDRFIETIKGISDSLPAAYRATVGMPGMIRHGVVISTPHYMTKSGPRTKIDPELQEQWSGFDMQNALSKKLEMPTRVLNDAEVHGAGIISGSGYEVVSRSELVLALQFSMVDHSHHTLSFPMRQFVAQRLMTLGSASTNVVVLEMLSGHVEFAPWLMSFARYLCGIASISVAEMLVASVKQI